MKRSNWIFGIWGALNVAAFAALHVSEICCGCWPDLGDASTALIVVALISVVVPFAQTAGLCGMLDLNSDEGDSSEHRKQVLQRWKRVFFRVPVASSVVILCFLQMPVLMFFNGTGTSATLTGETPENRLLTTGGAILFSAVPAYVNLFVVRKCQDFLRPRTTAEPKPRAKSNRQSRHDTD